MDVTTFDLVHAGACAPECLLEGVPGEACVPNTAQQPLELVQPTSVAHHRALGSDLGSGMQAVWQVYPTSMQGVVMVVVALLAVAGGATAVVMLQAARREDERLLL